MRHPFRYFNSSPEIIRLTVMMYIRPSVPFYNLPGGHREMTPRRILENAEVRKLSETHAMIAVDPRGIG